MAGALALAAGTLLVLLLVRFSRNLTAARRSGLPIVIVPACPLAFPWMLLQRQLLPLLNALPAAWTRTWLPWMDLAHLWRHGHGPFAAAGSDTVLCVSPQRSVVWTCDARVNAQLISRRAHFPKPVEVYGPLNALGPTLPGTEGEQWRTLRRVTARSFNEATNRKVWSYTHDRCAVMLRDWSRRSSFDTIHEDLSRMTFHVISQVCFGRALAWPDEESDQSERVLPAGHVLSYTDALTGVFADVPTIFLTPTWLLNISPLPLHRRARLALHEWLQYVDEMAAVKRAELAAEQKPTSEPDQDASDLLAALVQASDAGTVSRAALTGNIFVFHAAGHETTGSTLAFALLILACRPELQRELQRDLDRVLGSAERTEPPAYATLSALWDGFAGGILQETLRLFPTLSWMPKSAPSEQILTVGDRQCSVPSGAYIITAPDATHRNPRYWGGDDASSGAPGAFDPVAAFDPQRWMRDEPRPELGAFVPFWEGGRACLGQRFAQVEMCATLASIFHAHSLELAGPGDPKQAYDAAVHTLRSKVAFSMTLQLQGTIPLRLVPRGKA